MSEVRPDIDLAGFSRPAADAVQPPKRKWLRILVPLLLVLGFAAVLLSTLTDFFKPVVDVTVVRPVPLEGGTREAGTVLVQAAGWVEPDPFPVRAGALAPGIVREVLVQPSDRVAKGDPVARLVDEDAKLALAATEAAVAIAAAERDRSRSEAETAARSLELGLDVTESLAAARADVAGRKAESGNRAAAVAKGEAQVRVAEEELALQKWLAGEQAAAPRQVQLAEAKVAEAGGELGTLRADAALAEAEIAKAEARLVRAEKDFELRLEPRLRAAAAAAALALAEAKVREAETKKAEAALRLERMTVRAPIDGVVLTRNVAPGTAVAAEGPDAVPVCTLFDPMSVRIRVDIPQDQAAKAHPGQKAAITLEARREQPYQGEVIRVVQEADIIKTTLQVHVRVKDPDERLRPEMLCQVRILSEGGAAAGTPPPGGVKIPARLLGGGDSVWVVDAVKGSAALRSVQKGQVAGEWAEVLSGLNVSDKVIDQGRERLAEGARIRVREER